MRLAAPCFAIAFPMDEQLKLDDVAARRGTVTAPSGPSAAAAAACTLTFGDTCGLRHAVLGNGVIRAEILLDKGANVRQLWHVPSGARMLAEASDWREQLARFRAAGLRGSSYCDCYEGGYQDVLPARARWTGGAAAAAAAEDGDCVGEAAIVAWEVVRSLATPAAVELVCRANLPRCGLRAVKRFRLRRGDARLRIVTTVVNESGRDVSFSWTQHPALGGDLLTDDARLWLPERQAGVTRRDGNANGNGSGSGSHADDSTSGTGLHSLRAGWTPISVLLPQPGTPDRFVTFANARAGEAALASDRRGVGVRLRWDAAKFPHLWLWCARRGSICCVTPEPSTTYLPELGADPRPEILRPLARGRSVAARLEMTVFAVAP
jgi:hypothetical protein